MLRIKYNGEFLDLAPGQEGELQRNSPLFLLDNALAEYSTPITLAGSERNARLLGFLSFDKTQKYRAKIAVEVYNNSTYRYRCALVIEGAGMNRLFAGQSTLTAYILTGISDFFATIKDKKMTDLRLGGERSYNYTTSDVNDATGGFVQHWRQSWDFTEDYVMAPVRNEYWDGNDDEGSRTWQNQLYNGELQWFTPVTPMAKIEYLLTQMFAEQGWTVDFSGIGDETWKRLILYSAALLQTTNVIYTPDNTLHVLIPTINVISPLRFKLSSFMPAHVSIAEFLTAICTRYGFVPICNGDERSCYFISLKEGDKGTVKDWTEYSGVASASDFSKDQRIFQYKNDFEGTDQVPSAPSFEGFTLLPPVLKKSLLPDPYKGYYDDKLIFVFLENQYFKVEYNEVANARIWVTHSDNIYDEEVSGATDTFETKCTTLPVYMTDYRTIGSTHYYGLFPLCRQSRFEKWGIRTLLYHGLVHDLNADGSAGPNLYPYASCTNTPPDGTNPLAWSNVYRHELGNNDYGIIEYWFVKWAALLKNPEEIKRRFNLPLHEWIKFKWNDIILDNNIPYLIKSTLEHVAYKGFIEATLHRISLGDIPSSAPIDEVTIYVSLAWENVVHSDGFGTVLVFNNCDHGDVVLYCWTDAAGTVPYTPTSLSVNVQGYFRFGDPETTPFFPSGTPVAFSLFDHRTVLYTDITKSGDSAFDSTHFEEKFEVVTGTGYTPI